MTSPEAPAASIVVPTYRGALRLPTLLDAFAGQSAGTPAFEVVVVVDGVDDGSLSLLERESRFPLRRIALPENRGRAAALNTGFDAARGRVLIRCDDDLRPGPGFVRRHVAGHTGTVRGVIGPTRDVHADTPYARAYGRPSDLAHRAAVARTDPSLRWRFWAANCSITRETWNRIGPYDMDYRAYGWEDVDYGYRLHAAGIEVVIDPELETPHLGPARSTSARAQKAALSGAARRTFEDKHPGHGLPPAEPGLSPWNCAVRCLSHLSGPHPAGIGRAVDRVLPVVPRPVGRKLVALAVESAALGGYRRAGRSRR